MPESTLCNVEGPNGLRCQWDVMQGAHFFHLHGWGATKVEWPNEAAPPAIINLERPAKPPAREANAKLAKAVRDVRAAEREKRLTENKVAVANDAQSTSVEAATKALPRSGTLRGDIYHHILSKGMEGACDWELQEHFEEKWQTVSSSRNSLMNDGFVVDSKRTRPNREGNDCIVWVADVVVSFIQPDRLRDFD